MKRLKNLNHGSVWLHGLHGPNILLLQHSLMEGFLRISQPTKAEWSDSSNPTGTRFDGNSRSIEVTK
jgi:hypothetical protein